MTDANVVAFERPRPVPPLTHLDIHFNDADCSLVLIVVDADGNTFGLDYPLGWRPPDFDLGRLRRAINEWRRDNGLVTARAT